MQNKTLAAISRALEWPQDHLTGVLLAGARPVPVVPAETADEVLTTLRRVEGHLRELAERLSGIETALSQGTGSPARTDGPSVSGG